MSDHSFGPRLNLSVVVSCSLSRQHPIPFATIASIIRIAHKYQAQEILDESSDRLANFLIPALGHWIDATTLS